MTLYDKLPFNIGNPFFDLTDKAHFETVQRPEILKLFEEHVYGVFPSMEGVDEQFTVVEDEVLGHLSAIHKTIQVTLKKGSTSFQFLFQLYLPQNAPRPLPTFVYIFRERWLTMSPQAFPLETILSNGFAIAFYNTEPIADDTPLYYHKNLFRFFNYSRKPSESGTIGLWAFGASRVMDYLQTDSEIDSGRTAVIGHSRLGKTALWCGANDTRFSLVISNDSGAAGSAGARTTRGEQIKDSVDMVSYWFCENYKKYSENAEALPVDQHLLMACVAPRMLYIASASEDSWADPQSEFTSARLASLVYEKLYGKQGLQNAMFPQPDEALDDGDVAYHLRRGNHGLEPADWQWYLAYFRKKLDETVSGE